MRIIKKILKFFVFILSLPFVLIFNKYVLNFFKVFVNEVRNINFRLSLKKHGKNVTVGPRNMFEGLKNVEIGNNFASQSGLWLGTYPNYGGSKNTPLIKIGDNVHLSRNCHIGSINEIVIENNVLIGSNVLISDHSHGEILDISKPRWELPLYSKGKIKIGENCWLGDNTVILPGVILGRNCIVGANSVVTKSFPDNSVIAGVPAKIIKMIGE